MVRSLFLLLLPALLCAQNLRVVNAASFLDSDAVIPGSVISVIGNNGATGIVVSPDPVKLPTTLGGVTLKIGTLQMPLLFVAPNQINAQIDPKTPLGPNTLAVTTPLGTYYIPILVSTTSTPGLFSFPGTGTRDAAVLNGLTYALGPYTATTQGIPTYLALYATGLDVTSLPTVTVGGVNVPVVYAGSPACCIGLQQINIMLPPSLAGAGRVEMTVTDPSGKTSNVVEVVILPSPGQGAFPTTAEDTARNREAANVTWIPGTSTVIVADEADDVLRIVDIVKSKTLTTIVLPEGAHPNAIAVTPDGLTAVVTERSRSRVALVDLVKLTVTQEVVTGSGPSAVGIYNGTAAVVNQDSDSVSLVTIKTGGVRLTVPVKRGPRSIAIDQATGTAYVVNQDAGSISVINLANGLIVSTLDLGANTRPQSVDFFTSLKLLLVTEPSGPAASKAVVVDPATGKVYPTSLAVSAAAGLDAVVVNGSVAYMLSPAGGAVLAASISLVKGAPAFTTSEIKVDLGPRGLAVDTKDNLLVVVNEGDATLVSVDLNSLNVTGRVSGVQSENESSPQNDNSDRASAPNIPVITSITPAVLPSGSTTTITVLGKNLTGITDVWFFIPSLGNSNGSGYGNGLGSLAKADSNLVVNKILINATGTLLTCSVSVDPKALKGTRVMRVGSLNGYSSVQTLPVNTISVQ